MKRLSSQLRNFSLLKEGPFFYFPMWYNSSVIAFFSCRELDFSKEENIKILCQKLNIKKNKLVLPKQRHSSRVKLVGYKHIGNEICADALITNEPNIALGILTADCFSIFLYDPIQNSIGIVHVGWRGTKEEILKKTIVKMQKCFSTNPSVLQVAFGPGIRDCCYEVKDDLLKYFSDFIIRRDGKIFLDLKEANLTQLKILGIKKENIFDSGICTACQEKDFFSYRKEGKEAGRIVSVIMLKKN